jgi:predicted kinase
VAKLFLIVGLPGAGKTTRAKALAAERRALRLTPDEWVIALFGGRDDVKRWALEARLLSLAFEALRLDTSIVLDFGLWGRDERSALRWLARAAGVECAVVYVAVDRTTQLARIAHRQATTPDQTFLMTEAEVDTWRAQFQAPDQAELDGGPLDDPPAAWPSWPAWAADHWPGLTVSFGAPEGGL